MTPEIFSAPEWQALEGEFISLWTDAAHAYALFAPGRLVATRLEDGAYPALSPRHPGAAWFERLSHDLNGHKAVGGSARPAVEQFRDTEGRGAWPEFSHPADEGAHQIGIGPVHGLIMAPAHLRLSVVGETVLRAEAQLGYAHRGVLGLMRGKSPRLAARFAARLCGDATVAHSLAFAQAAEAALGLTVPPRGQCLRALMAELERIAAHAERLAALVEAAGADGLADRFALLRERICVAARRAFGYRLMMDAVVPGGVAGDINTDGPAAIAAALDYVEAECPGAAALPERLAGVGAVSAALATAYALGGPAGRASGRHGDAREVPGYGPYETLGFSPVLETAGDAAAQARIRIGEISESVRLARALLATMPEGQIAVAPPAGDGAGLGVAESARGPVWYWLRIENGAIADLFIADASAMLWQVLEKASVGGVVAEIPMLLEALGAAGAGVDL